MPVLQSHAPPSATRSSPDRYIVHAHGMTQRTRSYHTLTIKGAHKPIHAGLQTHLAKKRMLCMTVERQHRQAPKPLSQHAEETGFPAVILTPTSNTSSTGGKQKVKHTIFSIMDIAVYMRHTLHFLITVSYCPRYPALCKQPWVTLTQTLGDPCPSNRPRVSHSGSCHSAKGFLTLTSKLSE